MFGFSPNLSTSPCQYNKRAVIYKYRILSVAENMAETITLKYYTRHTNDAFLYRQLRVIHCIDSSNLRYFYRSHAAQL